MTGPESVISAAKHGHLRDMGIPTLFGAVVLFVSATLLLGVNVTALRQNLKFMEHSQQVVMKIAEVEMGIVSDELSIRGYALTADRRFLDYQKFERAKARKAADELRVLTAAEPEHFELYQHVRRDFDRHMEIFGKLYGQGPAVVAKAIVDPDVRANMMSTRNGLAALRAAELRDSSERQAEMTNQISRAFLLAIGIIIAAFVLGGVGLMASQARLPLNR